MNVEVGDMMRAMEAAGCTADQIVATVRAFENLRADRRREQTAKRVRAFRERNAPKRYRNAAHPSPALHEDKSNTYEPSRNAKKRYPRARVENNLLPLEQTGQEGENNSSPPDEKTPREVLLEGLRPEMADAVLAHRRAKKCPLNTAVAARALLKGFNSTADPNAAAETMIARGWQGFKPEWLENERRQNDRPKKRSLVDAGLDLIRRVDELYAPKVSSDESGPVRDPAFRLLPGSRG